MSDYIAATLFKARAAGAHPAELAALRRRLEQLAEPQAGQLAGSDLRPLDDLPRLDDLSEPPTEQARQVVDRLVVLKLNGGLGTTMGLSGPKSLLQAKPGQAWRRRRLLQHLGPSSGRAPDAPAGGLPACRSGRLLPVAAQVLELHLGCVPHRLALTLGHGGRPPALVFRLDGGA